MCGSNAQKAADCAVELLRLYQTYFEDEYEFSPVETTEVLDFFRQPFKIADSFQIRRRSEIARLDPLFSSPKRQMGFKADLKSFTNAENRIFHVYPFILGKSAAINSLLNLLLRQETPLSVSFRLLPTFLTESETSF